MGEPLCRSRTRSVAAALAIALAPAVAVADVTQPDGTTVPSPAVGCFGGKPGGLGAVFACSCAIGNTLCNIGKPCPGGSSSCDPGKNGTCEARLWHQANDDPCIPSNHDGLDPVKDAGTAPETFRPVCGLSFSVLARDAKFKNAFGWYNASKGKPDSSDLHLLLDCNAALKKEALLQLTDHPAYKGGEIGFFLVTPESHSASGECASGDCCATVARALKGEGRIYYSEAKHNPDNSGPGSYIHLLIYESKIAQNKFFFAWEDTFGGSTDEFTDLVTSVSGIACAGAGERCDTGKPGICGVGVTRCAAGGSKTCIASSEPLAEVCDGLDNDCDGAVDEDAPCDGANVCHLGSCVPHCKANQEFACQIGFECDVDSGICVDALCKNVTCVAGELCKGGVCGGGCSGVICPPGQECQGGACVDLCAGKSCQAGEVCRLGVCIPDCTKCGGITCSGALECDSASGQCVDPSCGSPCPAGTHCEAGQCVDDCKGVVCPGGGSCSAGKCLPPGVTGATGNGTSDGGASAAGGDGAGGFEASDGCACSTEGSWTDGWLAVLLALLALVCRRVLRGSV